MFMRMIYRKKREKEKQKLKRKVWGNRRGITRNSIKFRIRKTRDYRTKRSKKKNKNRKLEKHLRFFMMK